MQVELGGWVISGTPAVPIPRRECLWRGSSSRPGWLRWRGRLAGVLRPAAAPLSRRRERCCCHASCASSLTPHDHRPASLSLVREPCVNSRCAFVAPLLNDAERDFDKLWRHPGVVLGGAWRCSTHQPLQCVLYRVE